LRPQNASNDGTKQVTEDSELGRHGAVQRWWYQVEVVTVSQNEYATPSFLSQNRSYLLD